MIIEYSPEHIALLLMNIEENAPEERMDVARAIAQLNTRDKMFLVYVVHGYPLREAGRKIGKPNNSSKRFARICRHISMFLS